MFRCPGHAGRADSPLPDPRCPPVGVKHGLPMANSQRPMSRGGVVSPALRWIPPLWRGLSVGRTLDAASAAVRCLPAALARARRQRGPSTDRSAPESGWRARPIAALASVVGGLLGSVMLGPVAHADTLVSNSGTEDFLLNVEVYYPQRVKQRFTTGPGTYGWELDSIQLKVADAPDRHQFCVGRDSRKRA